VHRCEAQGRRQEGVGSPRLPGEGGDNERRVSPVRVRDEGDGKVRSCLREGRHLRGRRDDVREYRRRLREHRHERDDGHVPEPLRGCEAKGSREVRQGRTGLLLEGDGEGAARRHGDLHPERAREVLGGAVEGGRVSRWGLAAEPDRGQLRVPRRHDRRWRHGNGRVSDDDYDDDHHHYDKHDFHFHDDQHDDDHHNDHHHNDHHDVHPNPHVRQPRLQLWGVHRRLRHHGQLRHVRCGPDLCGRQQMFHDVFEPGRLMRQLR